MKKMNLAMTMILVILIGMFLMSGVVMAEEPISGIAVAEEPNVILKQGGIYTWKNAEFKNITVATIMETGPIKGSKYNVWIDGWSLDVGAAYEGDTIKDAAFVVGREVGTLGKYLTWINFPFKDKIQITLYPVGIYVEDVFKDPKVQGCLGFGYIKGTLKF